MSINPRASSPQPRQQHPTVKFYKAASLDESNKPQKMWVQNENVVLDERVMGGVREHLDRILKGVVDQLNMELFRRDE